MCRVLTLLCFYVEGMAHDQFGPNEGNQLISRSTYKKTTQKTLATQTANRRGESVQGTGSVEAIIVAIASVFTFDQRGTRWGREDLRKVHLPKQKGENMVLVPFVKAYSNLSMGWGHTILGGSFTTFKYQGLDHL